ncbi:caveolin-1 isoform X1 [Pristis pectinata]|uniref:caveolin-1 isoform X1 n=1 Tax=Pristis pectinata TaxID=685728 RepID=UPI00223D237D|nr:caveolin-1 isoform X1 [Pristis pectinata]
MSGEKIGEFEGLLYPSPIRDHGNIYKPNNKMEDEKMKEEYVHDYHTKEIDLVNRDPKHLNDDVVKGTKSAKGAPQSFLVEGVKDLSEVKESHIE